MAKSLKANGVKLTNDPDTYNHCVHAAHYELCLQYYKLVGPPEAFFKSALLFLQYAPPPPKHPTLFWQDLGVDLCLAALTGDGVYSNLGHVQTICSDLIPAEHPQRWLVSLLETVADGNVTQFQSLCQQYAAQIHAQPGW